MHTFEDMRLFLGPNLKMDSKSQPPDYIVCVQFVYKVCAIDLQWIISLIISIVKRYCRLDLK